MSSSDKPANSGNGTIRKAVADASSNSGNKVRVVYRESPAVDSNPKPSRKDLKKRISISQVENTALALANSRLRSDLAAAQVAAEQQSAAVKELQQQLLQESALVKDLEAHEGEMQAQFFSDQANLASWTALYSQVVEAQKQLMEQNAEVDRLNKMVAERTDEATQLRTQAHARSTPQRQQPPRRGKAATFSPVHNTAADTIEIPLNPAPTTAAAPDAANTSTAAASKPAEGSDARAQQVGPQDLANLLGTDVDNLARLFQSLHTTDAKVEVTITKTKRGRKSLPKREVPKLDQDLVNTINSTLRYKVYQVFNVRQISDFGVHVPATPEQVEACEQDLLHDPPADLYQFDFGPGYLKSRWNDLMMQKIVNEILHEEGEDGPIIQAQVHRDVLELKLSEHLAKYRAEWKKWQPQYLEDQNRMETATEAHMRALASIAHHQGVNRSFAAKTRKFAQRMTTTQDTIEIKVHSGVAKDVAAWERILEMLEWLGEGGMSSEEEAEMSFSGTKVTVFKIKLCIWREPQVADYLSLIDAQTEKNKKKQRNRGPKAAPRMWRPENGYGTAYAPIGLPKSLYNSEWLKAATPALLRELNVSKEAFQLLVAATDRMV
ncbi:hypothetical protein FB45DRAFT_1042883 [Roridomyces roridus]|uniref:Uncharacterized protein n=1 Tax=Roridomyces roridus TaxID=1738132 RepID=A0AAD7AYY1_9AGAR|nr:hypothetical protein FB45DRAFT_1042883 [Roridomyces roridus]